MKTMLIILSLFVIGCSTQQGVFYSDMYNFMNVKFSHDKLLLQTGNSKTNSAYLISAVRAKADAAKKELYLTGLQASRKDFKDKFEIDLKKLGISNIQDYKIIWVDPDHKYTNLPLARD